MASPREAVSETALSLTRAGQDQVESSELSHSDQVQLRGKEAAVTRRPGRGSRLKMASPREDVSEAAQSLTRDLETDEEVQAQHWIDAKKARVDQLERELRKVLEENRDIEDLSARLVRKINMLKANYARIVAGLERFRRQMNRNQS